MSSGMVPLELSKDNNQYCKISVFMPNAGSINESVISVTNVGGDSFSVAVSMIRWNANKVFCKLINGTKISNINMYYTVDTERFCFYIKANWYAKIIVSRLGLVNTSKIESINAIPSGAIEVPISWRDKRYSTELGGLLQNGNYIRMAEGKGSATLYRIDFTRDLNLVVKIVGEGNSEIVDDYSIVCGHGGGNGLCITHNSGPSSIRMYRDNDYNYYVYVSGWGYAIAYFANRIPIYNAISATKVDIDIRTLEQVGI